MPNPRVGDGVWVHGYKPQPNGKIVYIDWEGDKEVLVQFYDTRIQEAFEWDDFTEFNERLNQWIMRGIQ